LANWLELICYNFPFAFFSQLFFIQPFVRKTFKLIFRKDLKKRAEMPDGLFLCGNSRRFTGGVR
ncbi:MAG: hypothetical protein J6L05_05535, partial [Ruminococcus sp.]|nr:hypothetical protein [Ruminococcus sp.]